MSATLFLSDPDSCDGGVLQMQMQDGCRLGEAKLPAGDLVLYSLTKMHRVTPVTRGTRLASFFWIQSLVRDADARQLLFDLDGAIQPGGHRGRWRGPARAGRDLSQPAAEMERDVSQAYALGTPGQTRHRPSRAMIAMAWL